jgi:hypothetical protein
MARFESHGHPIEDGTGRQFEHTHEVASRGHRVAPLAEAHPGLEVGPPPGSPDDLRRQAGELHRQADWHRQEATRLDRRADMLNARADQDEADPPSEAEQVRRLLERGLG